MYTVWISWVMTFDKWKEPCNYHDQDLIFFEANTSICKNMDETWGHYTKWNKSDRDT